ncbi:MAG: permease prefix domain 1-containing protein [Planctomycetota bacterium]
MFDLNNAIISWRMNLSEKQTFAKSDIDEMESHLREEIESLTASKLAEQEAFLVATHRLGDPDSLAAEFAQVNTSILWRNRLFWMVAGLLIYIVAMYIARCASTGFVLLVSVGARGYSLGVVDTVSQILFFLAVIFAFYQIIRIRDRQGGLLCKDAGNPWGKFILFAGICIIMATGLAARILVPVKMARVMSVSEYREIALYRAYVGFVWQISLPVILLAVVICLRPSKLRKAGT